MREIKFRAQRKYDKKWCYGYIFKDGEETYILHGETDGIQNKTRVIPETISEFTGLYDPYGNEIYVNDIVRWQDITSGKYYHAAIKFKEPEIVDPGFYIKWIKEIAKRPNLRFWADEVKVVGNVFDNPELLEGENGNT